ncbi:HAMP domain-containing sensor histidine kinase [Romboutsia sp.]|uniref:sensor histidine kinase n=1 Tax=Romboutsia sp. TaxID=1965302 RepID=UPI002C11AC19|nr:HAMP domain-containing sensor histidine kinase [Romboutsia sp.]HSQ89003.1 HAMP domain-containing sensor histidine kinase [Romboutsia sp.]
MRQIVPKELFILLGVHIFTFWISFILFKRIDTQMVYYTSVLVSSLVGMASVLVCMVSINISENSFYKYIALTFAFIGVLNVVFILVNALNLFGLDTVNKGIQINVGAIGFEIVSFIVAFKYLNENLDTSKFIVSRIILIPLMLHIIINTHIVPNLFHVRYGPNALRNIISIIYILMFIYIIYKIIKNKKFILNRTYKDLISYIILRTILLSIVLFYEFTHFNYIFKLQEILLIIIVIIRLFTTYYMMKISVIDIIKIPNEILYKSLLREKEIAEARNEFLSNISHEFKTPVNVIYSAVQMQDLNIKNNNVDKMEALNIIVKQNCNRLVRLINNFIDSTKFENNNFIIDLKCLNIVRIVEDITMSVLTFAENKNIELTFDTCKEELFCLADIEFIERIVLNLLSNAIKYNKEKGNIIVEINQNDDDVIISVKDSGIGIPKDKMDKLFNRHDRIDRNLSRHKEGTGIGLNIVKQMVESLEGTIFIDSVENEGTIVYVYLKKLKGTYEEEYIKFNDLEQKVELELSDI